MSHSSSRSRSLEEIIPAVKTMPLRFGVAQIRVELQFVAMRDGARLATDLYLPPALPAPVIVMRTPYSRGKESLVGAFMAFARRGYVVVSQDCRGTGDSEPDHWDYYMYEVQDGADFVRWVSEQPWCNGFIGSCGGSYVGQTQWCMAMHPRMSTVVPEVSGLGVGVNTAHLYMGLNAYARAVGKGRDKPAVHYGELEKEMLGETLAGGFFNEPLQPELSAAVVEAYPQVRGLAPREMRRELWNIYCGLSGAKRAELVRSALSTATVSILEVEHLSSVFGQDVSHDAHTVPCVSPAELCRQLHAPPLMITGWYDWALNDALASWALIRKEAREDVRARARLIIAPSAHNVPGYREGMAEHVELQKAHRTENHVPLLAAWYSAVQERTTDAWPEVVYYLMGANEWRVATAWPVPESQPRVLYLHAGGVLSEEAAGGSGDLTEYVYDPLDPTPTVGGSIVSSVYTAGSVDVSAVQARADIVCFTTPVLREDLDVVGSLRLILYASSTALDTDFVGRLSDVFPDGRALQIQSGLLRARFRDGAENPRLLEPGRIYRLEIDLWATANRFKAGHRLRLDISSADFPRFDRNSNRGGEPGDPVPARQTLCHDRRHPSHLLIHVLP